MDLQPLLENDPIRIRPLIKDDLEPLYAVAKDPLIWEQHPCKRHQRAEFESFFQESLASKGALIIIDTKSNSVIGSSRYRLLPRIANCIEIGWSFLGRQYWGGVYNGAVKQAMMDYAFQYVDRVIYFIDPHNIRSQKAVEKIGGARIIIDQEMQEYAGTNWAYAVEHSIYSTAKGGKLP